jgi:hypothetical protein
MTGFFFIFVKDKSFQTMKTKLFFSFAAIFIMIFSFSCKKDKDKDTTAPVISIIGDNPYIVGSGTTYTDPGATAIDETDGDITSKIVMTNNVNTADTSTYHVNYNVADNAGNTAAEMIRTVKVIFMK